MGFFDPSAISTTVAPVKELAFAPVHAAPVSARWAEMALLAPLVPITAITASTVGSHHGYDPLAVDSYPLTCTDVFRRTDENRGGFGGSPDASLSRDCGCGGRCCGKTDDGQDRDEGG